MWRATRLHFEYFEVRIISIHALRVEGDDASRNTVRQRRYFNPRPPCGGRRIGADDAGDSLEISIHALRVEGDDLKVRGAIVLDGISIHALRVEGDLIICGYFRSHGFISIHALRVEGDSIGGHNPVKKERFQSTPSVWRATSTRASRTPTVIFQSTPSVWRATSKICSLYVVISISIHALRVEGDGVMFECL